MSDCDNGSHDKMLHNPEEIVITCISFASLLFSLILMGIAHQNGFLFSTALRAIML